MTTGKTIYEDLKHDFTPDEMRALGERLARETKTALDIDAERKNDAAESSAALKAVNGRIADLTWKINCRFEMRPTECVTVFDQPVPGRKEICRADTGEVVRDVPMTAEDRQRQFEFPGLGEV